MPAYIYNRVDVCQVGNSEKGISAIIVRVWSRYIQLL